MSAFGVEPRVPFLDKDFLDYVMTIDPEYVLFVFLYRQPDLDDLVWGIHRVDCTDNVDFVL